MFLSRSCTAFSVIGQVLFLVESVRGDCYARSGIAAQKSQWYSGPELVSCGNGTNNCCMSGQKCGSNLLCVGGTKLSREYCADPSWKGCSPICTQGFNAGYGMRKCGVNLYCCSEACDCNKDPVYYVHPQTGAVQNATEAQEISQDLVTWWDVDSSALLSPTSTPPGTSTSSTPPNITSSTTPTSSPIPDASGSSSGSRTQTNVPSSTPPSGFSGPAGIGIGLGIAAALAILAGTIWIFISRRKKVSEKGKISSSSHADQHRNPFGDRTYPLQGHSETHEMTGVWPQQEIEGKQLPTPKHEIDGTQLSQEAIAKRIYLGV